MKPQPFPEENTDQMWTALIGLLSGNSAPENEASEIQEEAAQIIAKDLQGLEPGSQEWQETLDEAWKSLLTLAYAGTRKPIARSILERAQVVAQAQG